MFVKCAIMLGLKVVIPKKCLKTKQRNLGYHFSDFLVFFVPKIILRKGLKVIARIVLAI
jgi:hypothetical protein